MKTSIDQCDLLTIKRSKMTLLADNINIVNSEKPLEIKVETKLSFNQQIKIQSFNCPDTV